MENRNEKFFILRDQREALIIISPLKILYFTIEKGPEMPVTQFPNPIDTDSSGLLAIGGDLHPSSLMLAYSQGIFPWPMEGFPLTWFCPPERAVLDFKDLHIPRSLAREKKRGKFKFTLDVDFAAVIQSCASVRRARHAESQNQTWITPEMIEGYTRLHKLGHAHSVEVWDERDRLAGGLYGVDAGGAFAAESMFYNVPYASKLALLHLIEHLRERDLDWMDIQVMTPHMEKLGAKLISRDQFLERLLRTRERGLRLF